MIETRPLTNDEAFDRWCRELVERAVDHRNAAWTMGDLLLEGLEKFDEARVWTAAEATGMTPETLTNYKSLAKTFRPGRRRMNLGISVHEAVRSLDETAQNLFLDMVEKYEITRENLRERVRAYKAGDAGAANYKWKPQPKVVEVEDSHAGVSDDDDDRPVFDNTDAGQGIAAEREAREPAEMLSDANQSLLRSLDALERATTAENCRMLPMARINTARLRAAAAALLRIADEADAIQAGKLTRRNPTPEATVKGEADGTLPRTAEPGESRPGGETRATCAALGGTPSAGTGSDEDRRIADVAQLDERRFSSSEDAGSSPAVSANPNPATSSPPETGGDAASSSLASSPNNSPAALFSAGEGTHPTDDKERGDAVRGKGSPDGEHRWTVKSPHGAHESDDFDPLRDMPAYLRR